MEHPAEQQTRRKVVWPWLLLEGLLLLVALPVGAVFLLYREVRPVTVWELTGSCPPASALLKEGGEARYAFDADRIDWTQPGEHWVLVDGRILPTVAKVVVQDTTPPRARGVQRVIGPDEELTADQFIADLADRQLVGVAFEKAPTFHLAGKYPVVIRLEDLSGNTALVETSATVLGTVPRVTIEAGEPVPPIEAFLADDDTEASFVTDVSTIDTSAPGAYPVMLATAYETLETVLVVEDTQPPLCTFQEGLWTRPGEPLTPERFVQSAQDVTKLSYRFDPEPDWTSRGYQSVTVAVTDEGGNQVRIGGTVMISDLTPLRLEASRRRLQPWDLVERHQALDESFSGELRMAFFTPKAPGCYDIPATLDGVRCIQRLFVEDTVPPQLAFLPDLAVYLDHPVPAESLLSMAEDETEMAITYVHAPDWTRLGQDTVAVEAVDQGGNVTRIEGPVQVVADTEPPQLLGMVNRYAYLGDPVSYFSDVGVMDNADEPEQVTLTVDNSKVDIYKKGAYPITYTATDSSGNSASATVRINLVKQSVSEEKLQAAVDKAYRSIIREDMTPGQKAYAIFTYVKDNFSYVRTSNKRDWKYEAWRGLTYWHGDCYTYCAAARILLEQAGFKTMFIRRQSTTSRHYWLMVDVGTGWYHFDPLNSGPMRHYECFMRTTKEVLDMSSYFWRYDQRIYPTSPETAFVRDW